MTDRMAALDPVGGFGEWLRASQRDQKQREKFQSVLKLNPRHPQVVPFKCAALAAALPRYSPSPLIVGESRRV